MCYLWFESQRLVVSVIILGIVAAAQEVVIVHAHNPMVVWQAILRLSFICICVRVAFQIPLLQDSTARDSTTMLFGLQKSHTFYGRFHKGS